MQFKVTKPLSDVKAARLAELQAAYASLTKGIDPATGKHIYVDCVVGGQTYRMNAGETAAQRMDAGIRLAQEVGWQDVPIVRDFHNQNHNNVPLALAKLIRNQQAQHALGIWAQKGQLTDQINACATIQDVRAVVLNFPVATE